VQAGADRPRPGPRLPRRDRCGAPISTNRLQADLEYLNGWTLLRDIRILLATLKVLVHRNAF
jgi:lipopolysaccharide/colanic/teichoic acid biosynthesis glycosyltransferase